MTEFDTFLAFFGGSGLHALTTEANTEAQTDPQLIVTPLWGQPSALPQIKKIAGRPLIFLNRHGKGHHIPPHKVNYRANVVAIKEAGATDVISFCAVGSLKRYFEPGTFAVISQYIDRTQGRRKTFFEDHGIVAHVPFAKPTCPRLTALVLDAAKEIEDLKILNGATLACIDGPSYSTEAETKCHIQLGADLVGMTTATEARLCREAQLCFANVAMITDYDCIDPVYGSVTSDSVLAKMKILSLLAARLVEKISEKADVKRQPCPHGCDTSLQRAVTSEPIPDMAAETKSMYHILGKDLCK